MKQIYLILFWAVDLKDAIEHADVCSSEMKSNIGEEISSLFIVITINFQSGLDNTARMRFHCMWL